MKKEECLILTGSPLSEGIAIGVLFFLPEIERHFPDFAIDACEVDREIARYRKALALSRRDLKKLQNFLDVEGSLEALDIIDTHIQMLDDPMITTEVEEKIRIRLRNTESVFQSVVGAYEAEFSRMQNRFFQERLIDVKDLSNRILGHLSASSGEKAYAIPAGALVVARQFVPSDTAQAPTGTIGAFIAEIGGRTSHTALIAQAKGIPFVAQIDYDKLKAFEGYEAIIDGTSGAVIANPTLQMVKKYQALQVKQTHEVGLSEKEAALHALTVDGFPIETNANVESIEALAAALPHHPEEIGLFRTEFLFLGEEIEEITEEAQFEKYRAVIEKAGGIPVVFRIFDIGSDKLLRRQGFIHEPNPALGKRALRFLLERKDLFSRQLRALLRASTVGPIKILFPFITDVIELRHAKVLYFDLLEELCINTHIPIGAMIEVPSAALTCDTIARECDFLSIGTNDLIQYTLASDRLNPRLFEMFKPIHPAILKLIKWAVDAARQEQVPVSLCGEMASNPNYIPLIIGLGIRSISCTPKMLPMIKQTIRQLSYQASKTLTKTILEMETADDVADLLELKR